MKILRALFFWFGISLGVIGLSGVYAWLNPDTPSTAIWRQS